MAISIEYLPDAVLLMIFSKLHATDLYNLQSVHTRFAKLIEDKYIWKHVNFGPNPLSLEHVRRFIKYLGSHTTSLHITGHIKSTVLSRPKRSQYISEAFFLSLKRRCPSLLDLSINRCYIDSSSTKFSCFPSSLKRLSLSGSSVTNLAPVRTRLNSPFFRLEKHLPRLQEIQLNDCKSWLTHIDVAILMKNCSSLIIIDLGSAYYTRSGRNAWMKHEILKT